MGEPRVWADGEAGAVIGADVWNERTVLATDWAGGRLIALSVDDGVPIPWGDGYHEPESVSVVGDEALITERTGTLLRQHLRTPGRAAAQVVASGLGRPHQVVRSDDGAVAFVADHQGGRVMRIDLSTGEVQPHVIGLSSPIGVALDAAGSLFVTEQGSGRLTRHDPDGAATDVLTGLVSPFMLSWSDAARTHLLVTERAPAHRVGVVDVTAPVPTLERLVGRGVRQPSQAIVIGDLLVVTGENRLLALDASGGLSPGVRVRGPAGPLWPGSWADVEIDAGLTGWTRSELTVTAEPAGLLTIDDHPGVDLDPARPTVRLLAHATRGPVDVVVRHTATMTEVGRAHVEVDFDAASPLDGPPQWTDSAGRRPGQRTLAAVKGVDDAGELSPKDSAGRPTTAWRVLAVLVDTSDQRWGTKVTAKSPAPTIATARQDWRTTLVGPQGVSDFYREMSAGRLSMQLVGGAVQGPVQLDGSWTDWFNLPAGSTQWTFKNDVVTRVANALQSITDWSTVDVLFLIVRSPTGTRFVWPQASGRAWKVDVKDGADKDIQVKVAVAAMPHDQATLATLSFLDTETTAHELGHTLGLDDLYMSQGYTAEMSKRSMEARELMCWQNDLPHLSARHKLLLGFLDPAHVRSFSYGIAETATLELSPASGGLPRAGSFAAVELKVAPRSSWFFEYRAPRPGRIGDGGPVFTGGRVLGYDASQYALPGKRPPLSADKRTPIILLLDDGDGDGSVLSAGMDYEHLDVQGDALSQFRLEVVSFGPDTAKVRVTVGAVSAPDPFLVNNNGPAGEYKSPDIQIRNELSDADPAWLNRPILVGGGASPNRVVATVRNAGQLPAPGVTVRFKVLPFNTDDQDSERWVDLGEPVTHDVPAGGAPVEFETGWAPDRDGHFCVQARIDRYVRVPGAAADEPDIDNNIAQSNYFSIASKPSSPATREVSYVEVHNPYPYATAALVDVTQDTDAYRTFVDHAWLHLEPGQVRTARLEVESKATSIWDALEARYPDGTSSLRTWFREDGCLRRTGSGVTLAAVTAVATTITALEHGSGSLLVRVASPAGNTPSGGTVLMQLDGEDGRHVVVAAPVETNGVAQLRFDPVAGRGVLHFSGHQGFAPCSGVDVQVDP